MRMIRDVMRGGCFLKKQYALYTVETVESAEGKPAWSGLVVLGKRWVSENAGSLVSVG